MKTDLNKGYDKVKQIGTGVLPQSEIYFSSLSEKAKKLYYSVLCAGHFYCDSSYYLKRESYASFLVLFVADGTFTFRNGEGEYLTAKKNDTVILDCYTPHEYFSKDKLESLWVHVEGANCCEVCREIISSRGNIIKGINPKEIKEVLLRITEGVKFGGIYTEAELSLTVYKLLLGFLAPGIADEKEKAKNESTVLSAKEYIAQHLNEKITVEGLAKSCNMSLTHFSRVFKGQTGFSPYDFVLSSRLSRAKEYLLKTDMTVTQIAYETGFNSQANFIYCFTEKEGISPGKFRRLKF